MWSFLQFFFSPNGNTYKMMFLPLHIGLPGKLQELFSCNNAVPWRTSCVESVCKNPAVAVHVGQCMPDIWLLTVHMYAQSSQLHFSAFGSHKGVHQTMSGLLSARAQRHSTTEANCCMNMHMHDALHVHFCFYRPWTEQSVRSQPSACGL